MHTAEPLATAQMHTDTIDAAAREYARATQYEHEVEFDRAEIKAGAVRRIMDRENIAATPAEKLVHTDATYTAHCAGGRLAAANTIIARGAFESAKRRADLAVAVAIASLVE